MFMEFPARPFNRLIRVTASGCRSHDLLDAHFGRTAIIRRYTTTHIAFGHNADQLELVHIFNHRRATAT